MHTGRYFVALALAACLVFGPAGCSDEGDQPTAVSSSGSGVGPGISIDEALKLGLSGPLLVNGWLLASEAAEPMLCSELTRSTPPGCTAPSLRVKGLDLGTVGGLHREGGQIWSEKAIQLLGEVASGEIRVKAGSRG